MFKARIYLLLCMGMWMSPMAQAESLECEDMLRIPFSVNFVPDENFKRMNTYQIEAIREDLTRAHSFALRVLDAPGFVEVWTREFGDGAQFHGGKSMSVPYLFGTFRKGQFVSRGRRHARTVTYHEYGHLIFERNAGTFEKWSIKLSQKLPMPPGNFPAGIDFDSTQLYDAYNELFADAFAVSIAGSPRAMSSAISIVELPDYISGRNFLSQIPTKGWNQAEPHIFFAPTRSALGAHPKAKILFVNKPEFLVQLVFDAIQTEMDRITGDHAYYLKDLKVEDINRRLINELYDRLDRVTIF